MTQNNNSIQDNAQSLQMAVSGSALIDAEIEKSEIHLTKATELCLIEIEKMARSIISKNKKLKKFTMAMGTYFFSYENKIAHDYENKKLDDFISKYDDELKLTGCAMTFTEKGDVITDW